jgi:hypothetical protein
MRKDERGRSRPISRSCRSCSANKKPRLFGRGGEGAVDGLKSGHIILTFTALRGLIERTAHAVATAAQLKSIKETPVDGPLTPVLELSETIHKALYATRREWIEVVKSDFRKTSVKDVQYVKKPNVASALPDNILNAIDKLDTTAAGTRLVYEILCEYLHPNVGDLWGATLEADSSVDAHGTRHLARRIGLGPKTYKGLRTNRSFATQIPSFGRCSASELSVASRFPKGASRSLILLLFRYGRVLGSRLFECG